MEKALVFAQRLVPIYSIEVMDPRDGLKKVQ